MAQVSVALHFGHGETVREVGTIQIGQTLRLEEQSLTPAEQCVLAVDTGEYERLDTFVSLLLAANPQIRRVLVMSLPGTAVADYIGEQSFLERIGQELEDAGYQHDTLSSSPQTRVDYLLLAALC